MLWLRQICCHDGSCGLNICRRMKRSSNLRLQASQTPGHFSVHISLSWVSGSVVLSPINDTLLSGENMELVRSSPDAAAWAAMTYEQHRGEGLKQNMFETSPLEPAASPCKIKLLSLQRGIGDLDHEIRFYSKAAGLPAFPLQTSPTKRKLS